MESNNIESNVGYGMKWHRFFCIALFITAAASIAHGVLYFIGKGEYQWLYDLGIESGVFPDGKIVTYIVGIITFICAPLALIARHKLAKRQKRGPLFFNIYLAVLGIRNIVYVCIAIVIFKKIDLDFGGKLFSVKANIAGMVGLIVIFLICMCYYHNRKEYFVN